MVKAFKTTVAGAAMAMTVLSLAASAQAGNGAAVGARISPDLASGLFSVARLRRARSMWFRRRHLRRSITAQWRTDRRHGRQAGMTTVRGAIRASTRKRDISSARTG